jgi:cytochrome c5
MESRIVGRAALLHGLLLAALAGTGWSSDAAAAAARMATGKEVYEANCARCHAQGVNGAPRVGDARAWSELASRGLTGLTESAIKGVRQMPAHGGNPGLTNAELERGIIYMVNQSGGHWIEPIDPARRTGERIGEQIVKEQCSQCHATGKGGAPKIGDRQAWIPRLNRGLDFTVRSAIQGHGGMPARGGLANLTDREVRNAVIYMFNPGGGYEAKR